MRRGMGISVVLAVLAAWPSVAGAQVTLVSQQRGVSVYPPTVSVTAPDFGPFNETVRSGSAGENPTAIQDSTVSPSLFAGALTSRCISPAYAWDTRSSYKVVFDVAESVEYRVSGTARIPFNSSPPVTFAGLKLTDSQGGTIFDYELSEYGWVDPPGQLLEFSGSGFLPPGQYTLRGMASSGMPPEVPVPGMGEADLSFALEIVPEPGGLAILVASGAWNLVRRRS